MDAGPVPPRAPAPPRRGASAVGIALLVLALIIVTAGLAVWVGLQYISRSVHMQVTKQENGRQEVSIKTPLGSLEVHPEVTEASLGLPIYPGSSRMRDDDWAATINLNFADEAKVRIVAGKFQTTDALEKVRTFYHDRLGAQVTRYQEKDQDGKTVFEIKQDKQKKVVALRSVDDKTVIDLARGYQLGSESN